MFDEKYIALTSIVSFIVSFALSALINLIIIKIQRKKLSGQAISEYLSTHHQNKKLTPTLGGVAIVLGTLISTMFYYYCYLDNRFIVVLLMFVLFFLIGLIDDLMKVKLKNYHGLYAGIRFFLEFLIAILCFYFLSSHYNFSYLHLFSDSKIYLGGLMVLIFPLVLVGSANGVNLTDGLDGLSSSLFLLCEIPFILFSIIEKEFYLTYLLISCFGATLGFITFNIYPSKIFMGDSGSLSLGSLLGITSLVLHKEIFLFLGGGIFVFETLSVILQVLYFKLTKKRLFLMAPFHHHLELKGKKEYQIVMYFFIIGLVLSFISVFLGILF